MEGRRQEEIKLTAEGWAMVQRQAWCWAWGVMGLRWEGCWARGAWLGGLLLEITC